MHVKSFPPNNEILKELIEYYQLVESDKILEKQEILIYPHYKHTATLHNSFFSVFSNNQIIYRERMNERLNLTIIGRYTKPVIAQVTGRLKALCIVFKPLGLNSFCNRLFNEVAPKEFDNFPYWNGHAGDLEELLYCNDAHQISQRLDAILFSFYSPFRNEILENALSLLHGDYAAFNVNEVAKSLSVSRKTLLRLFKKHLGVSLTDYRRILRFQETIKNYHTNESLTKLAYEACFSDQAHFIKDFRKLAGESPGKVFEQVDTLDKTTFFMKIL